MAAAVVPILRLSGRSASGPWFHRYLEDEIRLSVAGGADVDNRGSRRPASEACFVDGPPSGVSIPRALRAFGLSASDSFSVLSGISTGAFFEPYRLVLIMYVMLTKARQSGLDGG